MELEEYLAPAKAHPLKSRGITQATCARWNYLVKKAPSGEFLQLAVYHNPKNGQPETCKTRYEDKSFTWQGAPALRGKHLYGQHLWSAGGRSLTVTEGEIDALTVSQCFDHKYPVVSIPNGAAQAAKAIAQNLEWVNSFQKVVFMFDMDQPGMEAAQECAALLPPGKAFIARLPDKDPNELLKKGQGDRITKAFWDAEPYRPDGIMDARTLTAQCLNPVVSGIPWPWKFLTKWTYGRRPGEVYIWGGGTGIGKTDFAAEVIGCTLTGTSRDNQTFVPEGFGCFTFETGPVQLKKQIAGKLAQRRFHIPNSEEQAFGWTQEELESIMARMDGPIWDAGGKLFINNSRGKADWEAVADRTRFLRHAEGIKHFLVDPIAALVVNSEDERKDLDAIILSASALSIELGVSIYFASHLTRPDTGPSHEEGGRVTLKHFRGSNGIAMFADYCFGLERNQQADTPQEKLKTVVRSLKDRYTGNSVGMTQAVHYDQLHGTLDTPREVEE